MLFIFRLFAIFIFSDLCNITEHNFVRKRQYSCVFTLPAAPSRIPGQQITSPVPSPPRHKKTGLFLSYLGVDYEVFCMEDDFDVEEFKELMTTIQVEGFNPKYFSR